MDYESRYIDFVTVNEHDNYGRYRSHDFQERVCHHHVHIGIRRIYAMLHIH